MCHRYITLMRLGFVAACALVTTFCSPSFAQSGSGWKILVDAQSMGDWNPVGDANWRMDEGALVVDKKPGKGAVYLVSKAPQKNFQAHIEFWSSADANSGFFFRCADPKKIGAKFCYEANIFDKRKDPTYGTGAIVGFGEVNPMPMAAGKWNTMVVTANGRQLSVVFNGKKTVDIRNGFFTNGHFALQYGSGKLKFRKVAIKALP